jgi:hypothetical protein
VVIERGGDRIGGGRVLSEIREPADVGELLMTFRTMLREAAASGQCQGFTVTVHAVGEHCDHEL